MPSSLPRVNLSSLALLLFSANSTRSNSTRFISFSKLLNAGARGVVPEGVLDHLGRFKSFTTNAYWKLGGQGPLRQKSSYDRVIDMEKPFEQIVLYVLHNPVRKQLVADWMDWPYSKIVDQWW